MDAGTLGSIFTIVVLVSFAGVVWWSFSKKNKAGFDEAANLVFDDEQKQQQPTEQESSQK